MKHHERLLVHRTESMRQRDMYRAAREQQRMQDRYKGGGMGGPRAPDRSVAAETGVGSAAAAAPAATRRTPAGGAESHAAGGNAAAATAKGAEPSATKEITASRGSPSAAETKVPAPSAATKAPPHRADAGLAAAGGAAGSTASEPCASQNRTDAAPHPNPKVSDAWHKVALEGDATQSAEAAASAATPAPTATQTAEPSRTGPHTSTRGCSDETHHHRPHPEPESKAEKKVASQDENSQQGGPVYDPRRASGGSHHGHAQVGGSAHKQPTRPEGGKPEGVRPVSGAASHHVPHNPASTSRASSKTGQGKKGSKEVTGHHAGSDHVENGLGMSVKKLSGHQHH